MAAARRRLPPLSPVDEGGALFFLALALSLLFVVALAYYDL